MRSTPETHNQLCFLEHITTYKHGCPSLHSPTAVYKEFTNNCSLLFQSVEILDFAPLLMFAYHLTYYMLCCCVCTWLCLKGKKDTYWLAAVAHKLNAQLRTHSHTYCFLHHLYVEESQVENLVMATNCMCLCVCKKKKRSYWPGLRQQRGSCWVILSLTQELVRDSKSGGTVSTSKTHTHSAWPLK